MSAPMTHENIIEETVKFVKAELEKVDASHDWWHTHRVWQNARQIMAQDKKKINSIVVSLGALLHDIADAKYHGGDETIGPKKARTFLESLGVEKNNIDAVIDIVKHISFRDSLDKKSGKKTDKKPIELQIVQDADRLDAMGAMGIARAFSYGGMRGRAFYAPEVKPKKYKSKEEYQDSDSTTINHFYEKLFSLKDLMNTKTGKKLAGKRHKFMVGFVKAFKQEFKGKK